MTTTTDRREFQRALDMERGLLAAACERADEHPLGIALHDPSLPDVWVHNQLHVLGEAGDIDDLIQTLDELYADVAHRRVILEDDVEGERLAQGFRDRGWTVEAHVYMALRAKPDRHADGSLSREVDEDELRAIEARALRAGSFASSPEVVEELLEARARMHAAADEARYIGGCVDDEIVGHTTLYLAGDLAQVEDVATLESHRGRGVARSMVSFAVELARDADLIWIAADEADWPKDLYFKIGFRQIGRILLFTRKPG